MKKNGLFAFLFEARDGRGGKKVGEDEVVLVNEQKMLADKDWQLPLVCAVIFTSYAKWHQSKKNNKRRCWQQTGFACERSASGRKQRTWKTAAALIVLCVDQRGERFGIR